jgi:hypothetical protein
MKNKIVWAEKDDQYRAIRIFKSKKAALNSGVCVSPILYAVAVYQIRRTIWLRSKGECELCAAPITESSGHMHEQQHRGKGGEISLANSVFICPICHRRAHADRNPHFSKKT